MLQTMNLSKQTKGYVHATDIQNINASVCPVSMKLLFRLERIYHVNINNTTRLVQR